jgi:hypothetical protein
MIQFDMGILSGASTIHDDQRMNIQQPTKDGGKHLHANKEGTFQHGKKNPAASWQPGLVLKPSVKKR